MSFKIKVYKEKWVFGLDPSKTLKFQRFPVAKNAKKSGQKVGTKVGRDIFAIFAIFQSPLFLTKSPLFTTKNGLKISFFSLLFDLFFINIVQFVILIIQFSFKYHIKYDNDHYHDNHNWP